VYDDFVITITAIVTAELTANASNSNDVRMCYC